MATACPDQNILVIKVSEGGTSLRQDWNPDDPKSLYHRLTAVTKETCDLLTRAGATYAFGGMVWHQGESDSNRPDEYPALLTAFIDRVRTDLNAPGMPLVAGGLCADNPKYEGLNAALQKLAETTKDVGFASSKGLTTFDKNVHFDARSQLELGRRMAEAMLALTKAD
jgi:iduronate 2-sulfatase